MMCAPCATRASRTGRSCTRRRCLHVRARWTHAERALGRPRIRDTADRLALGNRPEYRSGQTQNSIGANPYEVSSAICNQAAEAPVICCTRGMNDGERKHRDAGSLLIGLVRPLRRSRPIEQLSRELSSDRRLPSATHQSEVAYGCPRMHPYGSCCYQAPGDNRTGNFQYRFRFAEC